MSPSRIRHTPQDRLGFGSGSLGFASLSGLQGPQGLSPLGPGPGNGGAGAWVVSGWKERDDFVRWGMWMGSRGSGSLCSVCKIVCRSILTGRGRRTPTELSEEVPPPRVEKPCSRVCPHPLSWAPSSYPACSLSTGAKARGGWEVTLRWLVRPTEHSVTSRAPGDPPLSTPPLHLLSEQGFVSSHNTPFSVLPPMSAPHAHPHPAVRAWAGAALPSLAG